MQFEKIEVCHLGPLNLRNGMAALRGPQRIVICNMYLLIEISTIEGGQKEVLGGPT